MPEVGLGPAVLRFSRGHDPPNLVGHPADVAKVTTISPEQARGKEKEERNHIQ